MDNLNDLIGFLCLVLVAITAFFTIFKFTIVKEGFAKNVTTLGSFHKVLLNWRGYRLDSNWNIVPGLAITLPFGIRYVGIRFLSKIDSVVSVKPEIMKLFLDDAETQPPERFSIDVNFQVFFRITNPWKLRFKSPDKPMEAVGRALLSLLRGWVAARKYDWIVDCKQSSKMIWEGIKKAHKDKKDSSNNRPALSGLKDENVITEQKEKYGITILEDGIQIVNVSFTKEYQELIALQEKSKLEANALATKADALVKKGMAEAHGMTVEALEIALKSDLNLQKEYAKGYKEMADKLVLIEKGAYVEAKGDGLLPTLMTLFTHIEKAKALAQGNGGGTGQGSRKNRGNQNRPPQPPQGPNPNP